MFRNIQDQTNAVWIPVFLLMHSCQFTSEYNEIMSATSQYIEEHHAVDFRGLSQRKRSREFILDQSWLF
jgi:hypothetical protein